LRSHRSPKSTNHTVQNTSAGMSDQSRSPPNINLVTSKLRNVEIAGEHTEPAIIQCKDQSLSAIRSLPKEQAIVLFTPAVFSNIPTIPPHINLDPLEPLGRAIHSYHRKVRHVPYALKDGFTYVHEAHLADASVGAVVVVAIGGENLEAQNSFADYVLQKSNRHDGRALPAVKIWIGSPRRSGEKGSSGWDSAVRCCCFDKEELKGAAALIFKGPSSSR